MAARLSLGVVAVACLFAVIQAQFNIPLPFGGISVDKNPDGKTSVGVNNGLNILGWGGSSGITFTGGNGEFSAKPEVGILANGTKFGTNSTFGGDKKKGVALDTDLNLGDQTVHGGVGKESQFVNELSTVVDKEKQEATNTKRQNVRRR